MINKDFLKQNIEKLNFEVNDVQLKQFDDYSDILFEWNQKINLTAITDSEGIAMKHFIDSLLLLKAFDLPKNSSLIDVGTGAGFPSVPVKIIRSDIKITMIDSLNKRINFLKELSSKLNINSKCIHSRAEELGQDKNYREKFDVATARAVANLVILSEYCLPFVKIGGHFIVLKGSDIESELEQGEKVIKALGGEITDVKKYFLPDNSVRNIIIVKKISQTATKYPRNASKIKKTPIN